MRPPKNKLLASCYHAFALSCLVLFCNSGHAERADRNKPLHLEADQGKVDDAKQTSTFEGNVQLTQGTLTIRGDKIVVVQDKEGFAHGTATGRLASFRQKREGYDEYIEGYGERIEYDTRSETVDFFGQARMKREQDEVRGDHVTYSAKTEIFQVHSAKGVQAGTDGTNRVRVVIQPKTKGAATAPDAEALPIKSTDTLIAPESSQ